MPHRTEYDVEFRAHGDARFRVLVLTEHVNATYYISFHFAFERLATDGTVDARVLSEATLAEALRTGIAPRVLAMQLLDDVRPNLVLFSRFCHPIGAELLSSARERGIRTIYHVDDDLLDLPSELGPKVLGRHADPTVLATRRALHAGCDLIYASTPRLHERLERRFPTQRVVSGMYASLLALPPSSPPARDITIGYMGSKGHAHDLDVVTPALIETLARHPKVRFEVFGTIEMPAALAAFADRVRAHKALVHYPSFLSRLNEVGWSIGIAPLRAIAFNHAKAPTKYVEYSMCGIPTLASDIDVYREVVAPGAGTLVGDDGWQMALDDAVEGRSPLASWSEAARRHCGEMFPLERLQKQIVDVFQRCIAS